MSNFSQSDFTFSEHKKSTEAATLVLLGSNVVISLLRKVIPDKVRIPAFITIIAAFVLPPDTPQRSLGGDD